jgi:hypothetical protein
MAMKNLLAIGLACLLPTGLAAEDPEQTAPDLGTVGVLVIEDSAPIAGDVICSRHGAEKSAECMAVHRAVLTARIQKVSARDRSLWM